MRHGLQHYEHLWSFGMGFASTLVLLHRSPGVQASQEGLQQQLAEAIAAESFDEAEGLQAEVDAAAAEIISLGGTPAESAAESSLEVSAGCLTAQFQFNKLRFPIMSHAACMSPWRC